MKFIWLSHILDNDTPLYGGQNNLKISSDKAIEDGDSCNTSFIQMNSHSGTHVDAPNHFIPYGKTIDSISSANWVFCCPWIVDIKVQPNELIMPDHLAGSEMIPDQVDFLMIKSGFEKWRKDEVYWKNNPGLSLELADYITRKFPKLMAIGIDFISVSSFSHRDHGRKVHKKLLENGTLIVEDMTLSEIGSGGIIKKVIALPLRFKNGDGAPVTIVGQI